MKISVGMTTYNSSKYVGEQIGSILSQTVLPDEIVICDDASTDNTVAILHEMLDAVGGIAIQIVENPVNLGWIKNFEKCFNLCTGDIVISCDADDVWYPEKVEKIKQKFRNSNVVYVYHDAVVIDGEGKVIKESLNASWDILNDRTDKEQYLLRCLKRQGFPYGMTMAFRRSILEQISPFRFAHDEWIFLTALLFGDMERIEEPLVYYRRHGKNTTGSNGETVHQMMKKTNKWKWFDWPAAYVNSYQAYYDRFYDCLPESVKDEMGQQLKFRKRLAMIADEKSRLKASVLLVSIDRNLYYKYRGNWKTLLLDCIFLLTKDLLI